MLRKELDKLKPLEHRFKAFFFWLFSPLLKRKQSDFQPLDGNSLNRVLFLRPEKIGDMVISFPVFDGLKKQYPHVQISILGSPKNEAIIRDDPRFERIFLYTKNLFKDVCTILRMRREKYDCVVDMICDDSVTALFLSQMCAPGKPRIGVGKVKFREYYDYNYDHRKGDTGHIIENTLKLLDAFGIDSGQVDGFAAPYLDQESIAMAQQVIRKLRDSADSFMIGYNLSAGSPTRVWDKAKSRELIQRILDHSQENRVVLLTTPAERMRGEELARTFATRVSLVPPGLNLRQAAALVSRMDLVITPDTSIVHIARAFKVDVIGLYSRFQKNFLLWRPYDQEKGAVVSGNDHNIFDIDVEQVYQMFCTVTEVRGRKREGPVSRLTVVVITKDEEKNLRRCLQSVKWADEIVVIDSQSTDGTLDIAREFGARIYSPVWRGFGPAKRAGVEKASGEWILSLDADEELSEELSAQMQNVIAGDGIVAGYYVRRKTQFLGRWIMHCGWYPDYILRLFRKSAGNVNEVEVHEKVVVEGRTERLGGEILHYSYPDLEHYFRKSNQYTSLGARQAFAAGKKSGLFALVIKPPVSFITHYLIKRGFLDGIEGFVLSAFSAFAVFVKYAKLRELYCQQKERQSK